MDPFINHEDLIVGLLTLVTVAICVMIHLEVLTRTRRGIARMQHVRGRMLSMVGAILLAHLIEICVFGLAYFLADHLTQNSTLLGYSSYHLKDYFYYSAVVYSTLGFGDLIPTGGMRILTGIESMTGLVLITWSASFTYLEMQRRWED